jgi:monomeric sarcosine oxidase
MRTTRRGFTRGAAKGVLGGVLGPRLARGQGPAVARRTAFDVVVVGAGAFGSWTAHHLQAAGRRVGVVDAYGPGNVRSSSGGHTRVIRMGYGDQEVYTRWSMRSLELWKSLLREAGRPALFQSSGVLWMARREDPLTLRTLDTLGRLGVEHERLDRAQLVERWPQIESGPVSWAIHEPDSGFLAAFRAVQTVAELTASRGAVHVRGSIVPPAGKGRLVAVRTQSGESLSAETFVFACGPWLPKLFPDVLGGRIFPTRQEVFYFGVPAGERRFEPGAMPVWVDFGEEMYGIPDFEGRGFKAALDRHGPAVDPDTLERVPSAPLTAFVREFVGRRFPALADAPVVAAEVCQYENTSNGDFLLDRHPELANVWMVGGGSGHGFKHAPAVGEYVAARIADGRQVEARFSLATKEKVQARTVF